MSSVRRGGAIGVLIAGSLLFGSTGAVAAPPSTYQPDPWAVLSVMSGGASALAVCGASAATAAAQAQGNGCVLPQVDTPPSISQNIPAQQIPVPPVEPAGTGLGISPLLLGLAAIAAGVGLYLALHHHGSGNSPT